MLDEQTPPPGAWQSAITTLLEVKPPFIHYQNGNNRDDIPVRFTVTMLGEPGKPMLTLVDSEELARRKNRRVRDTGPAE